MNNNKKKLTHTKQLTEGRALELELEYIII